MICMLTFKILPNAMSSTIILIGPLGAGKTTVGGLVAEKLG